MKKPKPEKPTYKAAYGDATLSDVTRAVLAYRPGGAPKPKVKAKKAS